MTSKAFWILAYVFVALVAGCFRYRQDWVTSLRSRATFELQCDQLSIVPLTTVTFGSTDAPLYQGVEGCGRRVVYVATISGYVLNSGGAGDAFTSQPPPAPPPPPTPAR